MFSGQDRAAAAWAEFSTRAEPVFPSQLTYQSRLISKWTRNGRVPTLAEAEALESEEYARNECLAYRYGVAHDAG